MTRQISISVILLICFAAGASGQFVTPRAITPEQSGDESAAAGKYNDATASYKQQWQSCHSPEGDGNAECETLRDRLTTKMAAALAKLPAPPTLPDDADYHAAKGMAFLKGAKSPADFSKVVSEFQSAVNLAPWSYDYQFNLAVALKGAANFKTALAYCKYARNLAQKDDERRETTALRAEIDAASEMAVAAAASAAREREATSILGKWQTQLRKYPSGYGTQTLEISQTSAGWSITESFDGSTPAQWDVRDAHQTNRTLIFRKYEGYPVCVDRRDMRLTVSPDGRTLTFNITPIRSDAWDASCAARVPASELETYSRDYSRAQ